MLTIQGRAVGQRRPLFDGFSVPPPPDVGDGDGPLTLRELIAHVVLEEVAAFEKRRTSRLMDRVLAPVQIDQAAARGKVSPEGRPASFEPTNVDVGSAVQVALQAFTDGLYLVVIDGEEHRDLDAIVRLGEDSTITFIRLTFLAGA